MATTIKLKNSVTTTNAPSSLVQGEVAINITDKKVWVGNAATTPIQLLGDGASASFGALSCTTLSASGVATFSAGTVSAPAITTTGDTNTGIFFPAADTIAFTEGGTESMRIDSSGNLGIGTTSPVSIAGYTIQTLNNQTSGSGTYYQQAGTSIGRVLVTSTEMYVGSNGAFPLILTTNATERMRIDSSGNVGIGTSSPAVRLQIEQNQAAYTYCDLVNTTNGGGAIFRQIVRNIANTGTTSVDYAKLIGSGLAINNNDTNAGNFTAFGVGSSERMRIDSSGNVGIGTSSPSTPDGRVLHISNSQSARVHLTDSDLGESSTDGLYLSQIGADSYLYNFESGFMMFATNNTERMRITSGGLLLVGTTTDNFQANGFRITSSTGQVGGITMTGGTGDGPQWQMINLTDAGTVPNGFRWLSFRIGSGASEIGKVEKASSTSVAYTTSSDYRLKENIAPITGALSRVAALKPVKWKWKNQNDGGEGFIAHELAEICPLAVTGKKDAYEKDGVTPRYQGVDTSFLVATLAAAIQELKSELDAVKTELNQLKGV
jgi:hypothetical protein